MILKNINHGFSYHTEKIALMFFPLEKIRNNEESDIIIITEKRENTFCVNARVFSKRLEKSCNIGGDDEAFTLSVLLFNVLEEITGFTPQWGILYGVRPARLLHSKCEALGTEGAKEYFKKSLVSDKKLELALRVMESENRIIPLSADNSFSLYVSIPFCPSRCSYCSFVSHSINNARDLIEPYVELLCKELLSISKVAKDLKLNLETVYFGGGTPTTLSPTQLDRILTVIENNFDLSSIREYTVEAGRPDTVNRKKLITLSSHNVTRISINPQTFNDGVLEKIGRRHTVKQVYDAFELARKSGFDNINTDLIAGLSGDTLESFKNSVDSAVALGADSITVHNLALKSSSYLVTEKLLFDLSKRELTDKMMNYSYNKLSDNNYIPYYMYRQSKSLGNLENCGWAKRGKEGLYNVFMMDETHTVLAAGAGAVTKLKNPKSGHIERIYNYKYPYEYIDGFDEVLKRKNGIYDFYNNL
ncbi:MAG: coproporphyrinogen dehydrogenase HemZ [Eubacterium sp.]|nr:coproporphyrinogen dehydrogenase HemZ [Eubacterium sp.]